MFVYYGMNNVRPTYSERAQVSSLMFIGPIWQAIYLLKNFQVLG